MLMSARQIEVVYERNLMQKCQMSMYAGPPRPAVTLTLTRPRTFIMLHFATHAHDVPAFSSPAFSVPPPRLLVFAACQ